jgi:hypothetical protein
LITRRQLLGSTAVLALPAATALAFPAAPDSRLRLGLLQSREPFMDANDIAGSRARALEAYRLLIQRSLDKHGPIDWLAGGAFPLSGPGPFEARLLAGIALSAEFAEVRSLAALARENRLRLTLGAWWREPGIGVVPRLLFFERDGHWRVVLPNQQRPSARVHLRAPETPGTPPTLATFAEQCRRRQCHGAWTETLRGPAFPAGAPLPIRNGSAIIAPDGRAVARAGLTAESCLVATVS